MKLRWWDWNRANAHGADGHVLIDYADGPIAEFLDWLLGSTAWHDDVELVHRRLLVLKRQLAAQRQALAEARAATAQNMTTPPKRTRREVALANLAKAQAARRAKRAAP
jgi:hypothetical protein